MRTRSAIQAALRNFELFVENGILFPESETHSPDKNAVNPLQSHGTAVAN